jgi:drug/metabolite transporter (DMT)-like permease
MIDRSRMMAIGLAFAAVYIVWGTTFLAIAFALRTIPAFFGGALRFFLASGLMYLWLRARTGRPFEGLHIGGTMLCGVLLTGIGNGCVIWAQEGLPSGVVALFIGVLPVMVLLFDWIFFARRPPAAPAALGVLVGLCGVIILTLNARSFAGRLQPLHVAYVMAAEVGWALGSLLQNRYMTPERVAGFSCLQMLSGAVFQLAMGLLHREWVDFSPGRISGESLLAVAYLVIFGSLLAVNCYSYLLTRVPVQKVSTYALVNPIIALALGALVLHEPVTPMEQLSAVLVLVGVALVLWGGPAGLAEHPRRLL